MPRPAFAQSLAIGKVGESVVAGWLRRHGFHVLPVYDVEASVGKGPVLYRVDTMQLIAPDMLIFKQTGTTLWVEAKTKSAFTWHRRSAQWVTGIDLRHYMDYVKIADLSPWPLWIMFLHRMGTAKDTPPGMISPTGLYGNDIARLIMSEHHRWVPDDDRGGMVYWGLSGLRKLATLVDVELPAPVARSVQ